MDRQQYRCKQCGINYYVDLSGRQLCDECDLREYRTQKTPTTDDVINYIEERIEAQPYEGTWIDDQGRHHVADVGYVYNWWPIMKEELIRVLGGSYAD